MATSGTPGGRRDGTIQRTAPPIPRQGERRSIIVARKAGSGRLATIARSVPRPATRRSFAMNRLLARLVVLAVAMVVPAGAAIEATDPDSLVKGDDPGQFDLVGIGRADVTIADGEVRLSGRPF